MEKLNLLSTLNVLILFCICEGEKQPDIVLVEQSPGNKFELFPDNYTIWFFHEQEKLLFNLSQDVNVTETLCPSMFRLSQFLPNELMDETNEDEFAFYHNNEPLDSDDRAHFVLHRQDLLKPANIYGQINHNGNQYIIQPSGKANKYRYREVITLSELRAKKDFPPIAGVDNILEVVVWIAPDLFKFTKTRLGFENNEQTAVWTETLRSSLIRDVDLTFRTLTELSIRVQYVGGGDTEKTKEPWYKDNFKDPYLAQNNALDDVAKYLKNTLITERDHAVVLTRADIAEDKTGKKKNRQAVATGTICEGNSVDSVSIAEVSGPFLRKIIAQAIGLGAKNCLKEQGAGKDFDDFIKLDTYGETYSNDEQCDNIYGDGSVVCGGADKPEETCYKDVKCQVAGKCNKNILLGDHSLCDVNNLLGCRYGVCSRNLDSTTTSSSTTVTTTVTSTTEGPDCCCEQRPLGDVKVEIKYIPCPNGGK